MTQPAKPLADVIEPLLGRRLGDIGFLGTDGELVLPVLDWPSRDELESEFAEASRTPSTRSMNEAERLRLRNFLRENMVAETAAGEHEHAPTPRILSRDSRTRVLGISSGKGGVGKSSVSVNLAIALAQRGLSVGVLDADVYGFSLPKMLGAATDPIVLGDTVIPTLAHGVHCVSMGYFVPDEQPVIWRGPMLHKAIEQLVTEAWWNEPDFLLIDMPPGTGDVALTLSEVAPKIEMYVVTTPQRAAQRVAQRSAYAARKLKLAVRGVIENMSGFVTPDGARYEIFGTGGGESLAGELGVPLLGQIPLDVEVVEGGDTGTPVVVSHPDSPAARAFAELASVVVAQGPARVYRQELRLV